LKEITSLGKCGATIAGDELKFYMQSTGKVFRYEPELFK
jgi:hypothetical protein